MMPVVDFVAEEFTSEVESNLAVGFMVYSWGSYVHAAVESTQYFPFDSFSFHTTNS